MKLLIVYGTTEGHSRKIAEFLKKEAEAKGVVVTLCDATADPEPPLFVHGVIILSSMHMEKYQSAVEHYIRAYKDKLAKVPTAFLSVSLTAASDNEESWAELKKLTTDFLTATGWQPKIIEYVAGALLYTEYDFFKKFILRMIAKKVGGGTDTSGDYVYTDWNKLRQTLDAFIQEMNRSEDAQVKEEYL